MTGFCRLPPLPEWRARPADSPPPPLFTRVSLTPTQDGLGDPCFALALGFLPIALYYPMTGEVLPLDEDSACFLGALNMELDCMTNPDAFSDPDIYAIDGFISALMHGWDAMEAFVWMVEMDRANRIGASPIHHHALQGLS